MTTTTDLPLRPRPVITAYRVAVCRCRHCGKTVRGSAPGLAPDQAGATAHRVGPGVMAAAHTLHYAIGIPARKVPAVLNELTGVSLTQSATTQDALRRAAGPVGAAYRELRGQAREAPVVYTDDTGWRIGGRTAFLMGFDTDQATPLPDLRATSQPRSSRDRSRRLSRRAGHRSWKSYDSAELNGVAQQKCLAHLLRNVSDVVENKRGPAAPVWNEAESLAAGGAHALAGARCSSRGGLPKNVRSNCIGS